MSVAARAGPEVPSHLVAREAVIGLGFSLAEAEERLASVDPDLPPEERLKLALRGA